jgi:hypothetical protein
MAVAADGNLQVIECAACDVVELQGQGIGATTEGATRVVRPQSFERPLSAALSVQFKLIHVQSPQMTTR